MELHQFRYFVAVADLGSFTRAAEKCLVAQPSLSQQIIKLERELRQPLFDRLGRTVRLNRPRRSQCPVCGGRLRQILRERWMRFSNEWLPRTTGSSKARVSNVGAIPTIAPYLCAADIEGFLEAISASGGRSLRRI